MRLQDVGVCGRPSSGVFSGMRWSAVSPSSKSLLFCSESRSQLCMLPGRPVTKTQRALGRAYECRYPGMSAIMTHVCGFLLPSAGRQSAQTLIPRNMASLSPGMHYTKDAPSWLSKTLRTSHWHVLWRRALRATSSSVASPHRNMCLHAGC